MNPNILFFLIDGLRADQCFGKDKTSLTPNIDSLIKKGISFSNCFSSVDGTVVSLNTIFSSNFQVGNAARSQKVTLIENNLIDTLKNNGYHIYGTLPNQAFYNSLLERFENENNNDRIENSDQTTGDLIDPVTAQFSGQKIEGSHSEYESHCQSRMGSSRGRGSLADRGSPLHPQSATPITEGSKRGNIEGILP